MEDVAYENIQKTIVNWTSGVKDQIPRCEQVKMESIRALRLQMQALGRARRGGRRGGIK